MQVSIDVANVKCPISQQIFLNPVLGDDGYTYEEDEIKKWMQKKQVSPFGDAPLTKVIPNKLVKILVNEFLKSNPEQKEDQYVPTRFHKNYIAEVGRIMKNKEYEKLLFYTKFELDELYKLEFGIFLELASTKIVKYVIDNSVDLEVKSVKGSRLIHFVSYHSKSRRIHRHVIRKGVDLEAENIERSRPIHYACKNAELKTIERLVKKGVNLISIGYRGWTPLHYAARHNTRNVIEHLADISDSKNTKNNDDLLPACLIPLNDNLTKDEKLEMINILLP